MLKGKEPKLILFIVMDTVRLKSISFSDDSKTPNLHRLINKNGALPFNYAISPSTWTPPSHVSLFTGLLPSEHKCIDYGFKLDKSKPFLPHILQTKRYKTIGITSSGLIDPTTGFDYGFDEYICTYKLFQNVKAFSRARKTVEEGSLKGLVSLAYHLLKNKPIKNILNYLYHEINSVGRDSTISTIRNRRIATYKIKEANDANQKIFLFINFMQPHMDYNPPRNSREKFVTQDYKETRQSISKYYAGLYNKEKIKYFEELYQAEVNYLDEQIGLIIDEIDNLGLMDESMITIMSDHGEHFGEHGHIF